MSDPQRRLSILLREVRNFALLHEPEDFAPTDDAAIGREVNEFRILLGRLNACHTSGGRVTGWGHLENQRPRVPGPPPATPAEPLHIPSDEDDDADVTATPRRRSRSKA